MNFHSELKYTHAITALIKQSDNKGLVVMKHWPTMTSVLLSLLFFQSDCGFDHVVHTLPDAKFHGETDDVIVEQYEQVFSS